MARGAKAAGAVGAACEKRIRRSSLGDGREGTTAISNDDGNGCFPAAAGGVTAAPEWSGSQEERRRGAQRGKQGTRPTAEARSSLYAA